MTGPEEGGHAKPTTPPFPYLAGGAKNAAAEMAIMTEAIATGTEEGREILSKWNNEVEQPYLSKIATRGVTKQQRWQ